MKATEYFGKITNAILGHPVVVIRGDCHELGCLDFQVPTMFCTVIEKALVISVGTEKIYCPLKAELLAALVKPRGIRDVVCVEITANHLPYGDQKWSVISSHIDHPELKKYVEAFGGW